jgi:ABC-type polysaccharide/polyol phosphate export permease
LWNFFAEITSQGLGSIVGRGDMIRKIKIPKWTIIFSSSRYIGKWGTPVPIFKNFTNTI